MQTLTFAYFHTHIKFLNNIQAISCLSLTVVCMLDYFHLLMNGNRKIYLSFIGPSQLLFWHYQ